MSPCVPLSTVPSVCHAYRAEARGYSTLNSQHCLKIDKLPIHVPGRKDGRGSRKEEERVVKGHRRNLHQHIPSLSGVKKFEETVSQDGFLKKM